MLVTVESHIKGVMDKYGFEYLLRACDLTKLEVLQLLEDFGYIDLSEFGEEE